MSACFSCPPNSHGAYEGANSIYGCTCDPGYLADDLLISWTLLADATYTPFDRSLTDALCNPCPRGSFFSNRGAETESSGTGFCYSCSSQPWLFVRQPSPSLGFDLPPLEHSTTLQTGTLSVHDCVCDAGYYLSTTNTSDPARTCQPCGRGTQCTRAGLTIATLPIEEGWWRASLRSQLIEQCVAPELCAGTANYSNSSSLISELGCVEGSTGVYCQVRHSLARLWAPRVRSPYR